MMPGYQLLAALAVIFAGYAVQAFVFTTDDHTTSRIDRPAVSAPAADRAATEQAGRKPDPGRDEHADGGDGTRDLGMSTMERAGMAKPEETRAADTVPVAPSMR